MKVRLYLKPGCHLCEDALADLRRLQGRYPHELETIDITRDERLMERYGERIPVLQVGELELGAPLMRQAIERMLRAAAEKTA